MFFCCKIAIQSYEDLNEFIHDSNFKLIHSGLNDQFQNFNKIPCEVMTGFPQWEGKEWFYDFVGSKNLKEIRKYLFSSLSSFLSI
jgi:hypothetical protein